MTQLKKLTTTPLLALGPAVALIGAPPAAADPGLTPAENQFISDLLAPRMVHPPLTPPGLVKMGHRACTDIGNGVSPDVEKDNLDMALFHQGIQAARAEVGTLVHFALADLCPNVPNTTGI
jgi:hypothetical protein